MAQQADAGTTSVLSKGLRGFSFSLYRRLAEGTGNVLVSPYSVSAALLLTRLGAQGPSKDEVSKALGTEDLPDDLVNQEYSELEDRLTTSKGDGTTLDVANRIFVTKDLSVLETYGTASLKYYGSEIETIDVASQPEESRQLINGWVEKQTKEKIKDLLPAGSINGLTKMVLANAVYFKGSWETAFDPKMTQEVDFLTSNEVTTKVDMMTKSFKVPFTQNTEKKFSAIALPYHGSGVSMVVVLPDHIDGLQELESSFTVDDFNELCNDLQTGFSPEVTIHLPRFKMELRYTLTETLPKLGIKSIFGKTADFSKMVDNADGLYVSDVVHKTFIDVTEEGTEAAAATGLMMRTMALPLKKLLFKCDHPFMYFIQEMNSGTILFMGRFKQPEEGN